MKITKTLASKMNFFANEDWSFALCKAFVSAIFGADSYRFKICRAEFSTKNPKKKGFKKITRTDDIGISFKEHDFVVCFAEQKLLDNAGIKDGQAFWVKIELA